MINGGNDVKFQFAVRRRLEDARVDFDLFDTRTVELFEGCDNPRLLASAGGTINEEMREVAALRLKGRPC